MEPRSLPLLIQPQVLFPGAILPLRLRSARQRKMAKDVIAADKLIGVISLPWVLGVEEGIPRVGQVGCLARVTSAKKLPAREVRLVVEGVERFSITKLLDSGDSYQRAEVAPYVDFEESPALLDTFAEEVRQFYQRYARATVKIGDSAKEKAAQLPSDPVELSMHLPALLHLDEETSQRFLASRSTLMRLRELSAILAPAASSAEANAEVHVRSRTNGHGAKRS